MEGEGGSTKFAHADDMRREGRGFAGLEALALALSSGLAGGTIPVWIARMGKWRETALEHGQNWVKPIREGTSAMALGTQVASLPVYLPRSLSSEKAARAL